VGAWPAHGRLERVIFHGWIALCRPAHIAIATLMRQNGERSRETYRAQMVTQENRSFVVCPTQEIIRPLSALNLFNAIRSPSFNDLLARLKLEAEQRARTEIPSIIALT